VARCFSAASMKMVNINMAVRNISMKTPRTTDVYGFKVVRTASGLGNMACTAAAAAIAPTIWAMIRSRALSHPIAPTSARATVTCIAKCQQMERREWNGSVLTAGLNSPPLIRKKTQTLTAREKPNANEI